MIEEISESDIKKASLNFVKGRFGCHNLKLGEERGLDLKSHRISFEAGVSTFLLSIGFVKKGKSYIREIR